MDQVTLDEARTNLSRLVEQAANGRPFIIAEAGRPLVKVVAVEQREEATRPLIGFMDGEGLIPDDFDTMGQDEIIRMFEHGK